MGCHLKLTIRFLVCHEHKYYIFCLIDYVASKFLLFLMLVVPIKTFVLLHLLIVQQILITYYLFISRECSNFLHIFTQAFNGIQQLRTYFYTGKAINFKWLSSVMVFYSRFLVFQSIVSYSMIFVFMIFNDFCVNNLCTIFPGN